MESTEATFLGYGHTVGVSSVLEDERPTHSDFDEDGDESYIRSVNNTPAVPASAEVRQSERQAAERRVQKIEDDAFHALLGRKAVDAFVIAAVTDNHAALGHVVEELIDGVTVETGPIDISTADGTVRVIEAVTELAREVEEQANHETIQILRDRIAKLEALVEADPVLLMAELEQQKQKNVALSQTIRHRDATITDLQTQRDDRARQDAREASLSQESSLEANAPHSLRQRLALGARSVLASVSF